MQCLPCWNCTEWPRTIGWIKVSFFPQATNESFSQNTSSYQSQNNEGRACHLWHTGLVAVLAVLSKSSPSELLPTKSKLDQGPSSLLTQHVKLQEIDVDGNDRRAHLPTIKSAPVWSSCPNSLAK